MVHRVAKSRTRLKRLGTHTRTPMSVHLQLCIKMFAVAGHRFYYIYKLGSTEHPHGAWRPSFPQLRQHAPQESRCWLGPLLNVGPPIFHLYRPSAPLPPELSARAQRLHLCSAPGTLLLDQASLLSKTLLSESSRYTGRQPCTWSIQQGIPASMQGPLWRG